MNKITPGPRATLAAALLAGGMLAMLAGGASRAADSAKPVARPALTVTAAVPQRASLPIALAANGNLAAWQEAIIGAETAGLRLAQVHASVGDRVRKGQLLATFSADTVRVDMAQARASVAEAEALAGEAAANAERARSLQATGALSASQINQYLTAEKTALARLESARALLQAQQLRLAQTEVLAPDSGIISARNATVGAVPASGTELFRLIRQGRLEWRAEVTSAELGRIAPGTTASVTAASGARLAGRVRTIGPTVDAQTRSALVFVDLQPLPGPAAGGTAPALPGMFARGQFELGATPALTLPQAAVVVREGFSYVYRIGADQRVVQLKVQTGRLAGDRVEITGGLPPDARVVAAGAGFLNDGDLVRVVDAASPPARPASAAAGR